MMPLGVLAVTSGMNLPTISAIPRPILGGDGNHYPNGTFVQRGAEGT